MAFLFNTSEKLKPASSSEIQVKNWQKTEEKLDVISQLEKGELIVDLRCNVRLTHSSVHTIRDSAERINASAKSGTKLFV